MQVFSMKIILIFFVAILIVQTTMFNCKFLFQKIHLQIKKIYQIQNFINFHVNQEMNFSASKLMIPNFDLEFKKMTFVREIRAEEKEK